MKFGQLTECNMNAQNMVKELFPDRFFEKLKLSISLDQYSKVLYSLFLLYAKLRTIEIY